MSWLRLDDRLTFHAKIVTAGNAAVGAWVRLCAWSALQLTDGLIPEGVAAMIGKPEEIAILLSVGLLERDGFAIRVHDYLEYNPSRKEVIQRRSDISKSRSDAGKLGASKRWQKWQTDSNAMANANGKRMAPSRPLKKEKRERESRQDRYEPGSGTIPVATVHTPLPAPISDTKHRERAQRDAAKLAEWSIAEQARAKMGGGK